MALAVIAGVVAVGVAAGSSGDTTPGPDDSAPEAAVANERDRQPTDEAPTTSHERDAPQRDVTTRGADGKTYSCAFSAMDRVDAAKDRVTRREKVLKARRAAVRRIVKQYPSGKAPGDVVDRYEKLRARANVQVTWTNKAIDQYNRVLRDACDRV